MGNRRRSDASVVLETQIESEEKANEKEQRTVY